MKKAGLSFFSLILSAVLVVMLHGGQEPAGRPAPAPKSVDLQRVDIRNLPEIRVYFTVTDEGGESVTGLTEEELEITIDDVVQPLSSLTSAFEGGTFLA
ncbi:MAG: hypothetical protein ABIK95_10240, partial [Acidobacteriota bacterium]